MTAVVTFPPPEPVRGKNRTPRHPMAYHRLKQAWQRHTTLLVRSAAARAGMTPREWVQASSGDGPYRVHVTLPMARPGAADPHNYTSYEVAWIIDGLVDAGAIPDDTARWVEVVDPTLVSGPASGWTVRVEVAV